MSLLKFIGNQNSLSNQVGVGLATIVGPTGSQGPQGFQGNQGFQGFQGFQGLWQGFQGVQGPQGFQGLGFQGNQGSQGFQGSQGWQGSIGYQGSQGWQGISGFSTNTGAQGWQGPQGLQGIQGIQGVQGYIGPTGTVNFQSGTFQTLNADTFYVTNVTMPSGSKINSPYDTVFIDGHLNVSNIFTVSGINSNVRFCNFTGGAMLPTVTVNGVQGKVNIGPSFTGTFSVSSTGNTETIVLGYNPTPGQSPWYHNFYNKQLALLGAYNQGYNMGSTGYTGSIKLYIGNYNNDLPESVNMYPIVCEDENGYVDFFIKAQTNQGALDSVAHFGGRIGVGVTGPINKLDVAGGAVIGTFAGTTTGPANGLLVSGKVGIGTQEDTNYFLTVGGNQMLKSTSNPGLVFYNTALSKQWILGGAPTDRFRIDYYDGGAEYEYLTILPGGKVGITSSNPTYALQVGAGGRLAISNGAGSLTMIGTQDSDSATNTRIVISEVGRATYGGNIEYLTANGPGGHHIFYKPGQIEAMRLNNLGLLGVGTYPWFPQSIGYNGTGTATGAYKYNFGLEIYNNYVSPNFNSDVTNCIVFSDLNSVQGGMGGYRKSYAQNYIGGLVFLVGNQPAGYNQSRPSTQAEASKSLTELMRLTPALTVGIGTTAPNSKVQVHGGGADTELSVTTDDGWKSRIGLYEASSKTYGAYLQYNGTNDNIEFGHVRSSADVSPEMVIQVDTGNVGIGKTNPQTKLNINSGGIYLENGSLNGATRAVTAGVLTNEINGGSSWGADAGQLRLSAGGGTTAGTKSYIDLYGYNSNYIAFGVGSENMRLTYGGNLGINTTNPQQKLEIRNDSGNSYIRISGAYSYAKGIEFYDNTNSNSRWLQTNSYGDMRWYSSNGAQDKMVLNEGGSLYITGSYASTNSINDAFGNSVRVYKNRPGGVLANNELGYFLWGGLDSSSNQQNGAYMIATTSGNWTSSNFGTELYTYSVLANSTTMVLRTRVGADGFFRIYNTSATQGAFLILNSDVYSSGGRNWAIGSALSGNNAGLGKFDIYDYYVGQSRLTIDTTGQVGIGITSPSAKLHVNDQNAGNTIYTMFKTSWNYQWDFRIDQHHINGSRINYYLRHNFNGSLSDAIIAFDSENIGIGTQYPTAKLDVSRSSQPQINISQTNYTMNPGSDTNIGVIQFRNDSASSYVDKFCEIKATVRAGNYEPSLTFWTKPAWNIPAQYNGYMRMIITEYGQVGINTNTPPGKLSVYTASNTNDLTGVGNWDDTFTIFGRADSPNGKCIGLGFNDSYGGVMFCLQPGVGWHRMNHKADSYYWYNANGTQAMSLSSGFYIGVTDVNGYNIAVPEGIYCKWLTQYSDSRIKKNIVNVDKKQCLDVIMNFDVAKYDYVCEYQNSATGVVGFIAQQIETVEPNCVKIQNDYIPNINSFVQLEKITSQTGVQEYTFVYPNFSGPVGKVRFITKDDRGQQGVIDCVIQDYVDGVFRIKADSEFKKLDLFCFGTMVEDFHSLNKDRIFAYGVGAIQDLALELIEAKEELKSTKDSLQSLISLIKSSTTFEELKMKL